MAVPGPVTSALSIGSHHLAREPWATLVGSVRRPFLEDLGPFGDHAAPASRPRGPLDGLSTPAVRVHGALRGHSTATVGALARESGVAPGAVVVALDELAAADCVIPDGGRGWCQPSDARVRASERLQQRDGDDRCPTAPVRSPTRARRCLTVARPRPGLLNGDDRHRSLCRASTAQASGPGVASPADGPDPSGERRFVAVTQSDEMRTPLVAGSCRRGDRRRPAGGTPGGSRPGRRGLRRSPASRAGTLRAHRARVRR